MKRFMIVFGVVAAACVSVHAQSAEDEIARAVLAAPRALAEAAMVVRIAADGSHEVLREGTNGLVCYDRSNEPGRSFAVQCTDEGNLERAKQTHRLRMSGGNAEGGRKAIAAAEADGSRVAPAYGSVWYSLTGQDQASVTPHQAHITVAVPFATGDDLKLPEEGAYNQAGTWIMDAGTSASHIMIPGR